MSVQYEPESYIPLTYIYIGFICFWFLFLCIWVLHLIIYRKYRLRLHTVMTIVPAIKLLSVVSGFFVFWWCAYKGQKDNERTCTRSVFAYIYNGIHMFYEVSLFIVLTLLALGWCITRTSLNVIEKRTLILNMICLAVCTLAIQLSIIFSFVLVIMYVILLAGIFRGIFLNVKFLYLFLFADRENEQRFTQTPTYQKILLFRKYQFSLIIFVCIEGLYFIVITIAAQSIPNYIIWLQDSLQELIEAMIIMLVYFIFRLRNFSRYTESRQDDENQQQDSSQLSIEEEGKSRNPVIVIENPPHVSKSGKAIKSYSVVIQNEPEPA